MFRIRLKGQREASAAAHPRALLRQMTEESSPLLTRAFLRILAAQMRNRNIGIRNSGHAKRGKQSGRRRVPPASGRAPIMTSDRRARLPGTGIDWPIVR